MSNYRLHPDTYENLWTDRSISRVDLASRKEVFQDLLPKDAVKILEVGCGAGYNLSAISSVGKNYKLTGMDILDHAVNEANRRCGDSINILSADGLNTPFSDNCFDLVLACGYLDWIVYDNLARAISELIRVSGKYIVVIDYMTDCDDKIELLVCHKGLPLYIVRNYFSKFDSCCVITYIEELPEKFSKIPMSALLFKKI